MVIKQITYNYFCLLGGNSHPDTFTRTFYNGAYHYIKYYKVFEK